VSRIALVSFRSLRAAPAMLMRAVSDGW